MKSRPNHVLPDLAYELYDKLVAGSEYDGEFPGACLIWKGRTNKGYGSISARYSRAKGNVYGHVLSYLINHGPVPDGLDVRHLCHSPGCSNPGHLRAGTRLENMADSVRAGRVRHGMGRPEAKLTDDVVRQIVSMAAEGYRQAKIGERFGIDQPHVSAIVNGKRWKHITRAA